MRNEVCKLRTGSNLESFHDVFFIVDKSEEYPNRGFYRQIDNQNIEYIGHKKSDVIDLLECYPAGSVLWVPNRDRKRGGFVATAFDVGSKPWNRVVL